MPCAHGTVIDTTGRQKSHSQHAGVRDTVNTCSLEPIQQLLRAQLSILHAEVAVRHDGIQRFSCLAQDHLGQRGKRLNRISADTHIANKSLVSQPSELYDSSENLLGGYKLDVVCVNKIEIGGTEALKTATNAISDPSRWRGQLAQRIAEQNLGGTIIGRSIETEDIVSESTTNDVGVWHVSRVWMVLVVEGGCSEDQRREDLGERFSHGGHCKVCGLEDNVCV
ncbi:hypothetical protein HG530_002787 [Fusarium avenaceum]|nr:hypothetical protein HG530_002787 [Fusarium avenaceum]